MSAQLRSLHRHWILPAFRSAIQETGRRDLIGTPDIPSDFVHSVGVAGLFIESKWGLEMPFLLNRRSLFVAAAAALSASGVGQAKTGRAFEIATSDGAPIRNFRIAPAKAPSDLPGLILTGSANAEPVLYEFFDYACPYCRVASQEIDMLLSPDSGVRLGLVQHPVLSSRSADAARVALAASRLHGDEVAYRLHVGIFQAPGAVNAEKALAVAAGQGLDAGSLAKEAERAEIAELLAAHVERARTLSLPQAPSFVLGEFAFVGWPGVAPIESFIAATRRCGGLRCASPY